MLFKNFYWVNLIIYCISFIGINNNGGINFPVLKRNSKKIYIYNCWGKWILYGPVIPFWKNLWDNWNIGPRFEA